MKRSGGSSVPGWLVVLVITLLLVLVALAYKWMAARGAIAALSLQNVDNELEDLAQQKALLDKREKALMDKRAQLQTFPPTWSTDEPGRILIELQPNDEQYWSVTGKFP